MASLFSPRNSRRIEPLFQDRTPEAAARQLATVLAWLMEAELATLERLERLSSSSKRETERHRDIDRKGVHHCQKLGVEPRGLKGKMCTRLATRLEEGGPAPSAKDREYGPDG